MWPAIQRLREQLMWLRHYVDGLDKQDAITSCAPESCGSAAAAMTDLANHFRTGGFKTRYEYNTVIVSLYGNLERFVEDIIEQYVTRVTRLVPNYLELPEKIRTRHIPLSLELARKADFHRYATAVRVEEVIERLNTCFTQPDRYELNAVAFAQHTSNVRHAVIAAMLTECGLSDVPQVLRHADPFTGLLQREDAERDVDLYLRLPDDVVFFRLTDLANRRNDVSHGIMSDDTMSRELLRSYVDFVEAYCEAMALVLFERTLPFVLPLARNLGQPIAVFNNRIVAVELTEGQLTVGDILVAETQDPTRPFKGGPILSIERDHVAYDCIDGGPGVKVGAAVGFGAKPTHRFHHISSAKFREPFA